jgi:hypothetical protein
VRFTWQRAAAGFLMFGLGSGLDAPRALAAPPPVELAKFTGVSSCQSSLCHGGGVDWDQCNTWATVDFHVRAFAILLTPRSRAITDSLHSGAPTANDRCTVCHSPFAAVPASRLMPAAHADEGVSCESCHGPASGWLRSHTRKDYTYADRIASGMSELRSSYGRANTCVACHEYLSPDIAKAGHPELIFELDSQTVSEPPHWHDGDSWIGLHSWLAGQAVAFREETWHILREPGASSRWEALGWLLERATDGLKGLPDFTFPKGAVTPGELADLEKGSDRLARSASDFAWTTAAAERLLKRLASSGAGIRQVDGMDRQSHRAEVLAQGLDRLLVELNHQGVSIPGATQKLDLLFADVRLPDSFDAAKFCRDLDQFSNSVGKL